MNPQQLVDFFEWRGYVETMSNPSGASARGPHRLAEVWGCERAYSFRYLNAKPTGVPQPDVSYQLTGTLVHMALAYHFASLMDPVPQWAIETSLDDALQKLAPRDPELCELAKNVLAAYKEAQPTELFDVVTVEEEYRITLGKIFPDLDEIFLDKPLRDEIVTCRTDLVVRSKIDKKLYIYDHKCSPGDYRSSGLPVWRDDNEFAMSSQAIMNILLVSAHHEEQVGGFFIQRVRRREPFAFDRHILNLKPEVIRRSQWAIIEAVKRDIAITAKHARGEDMQINPFFCYGGPTGPAKYGPCQFINFCEKGR